jgi:hypothetical protein
VAEQKVGQTMDPSAVTNRMFCPTDSDRVDSDPSAFNTRIVWFWSRFYETVSAEIYGLNLHNLVKFRFVKMTWFGFKNNLKSKIVVCT